MTPGVTVSGNTVTVNLTIQPNLRPASGYLLIPEAKVFVIHLGNDQYRAFTSICTHEACDVDTFFMGRIRCPCHGSQYDFDGMVVDGPAPAPLRRFTSTLSGSTLSITKA